jgi:hypothetical protein
MLATVDTNTNALRQEGYAFQAKVLEALSNLEEKLDTQLQELKAGLEETRADWAMCKRAVASGSVSTHTVSYSPRIEAPKPKEFDGKRDAKEIDNFLWHLERYFEALGLTDEMAKVRTATLYLTNLAATWWRRKHAEIEKGTCAIKSWEEFKAELKRQFYPENVAQLARKKMKELKHNRSIREYVEEFSGLMLQIPNMSEEDFLFNFMDGLQFWAAQELQRRGVQDIATALTIAETLIEYKKSDPSNSKNVKVGHVKGGGDKDKQFQHKEGGGKPPKGKEWKRDYKQDGKGESKPKDNCFLCNGPHWARDCPKRKALNALLEEQDSQEEEANMGCLQLLNALKANPMQQRQVIDVCGG